MERQDASAFQPLPFHYIEVTHFIFQSGFGEGLAREVFGDEATAAEVRDPCGWQCGELPAGWPGRGCVWDGVMASTQRGAGKEGFECGACARRVWGRCNAGGEKGSITVVGLKRAQR